MTGIKSTIAKTMLYEWDKRSCSSVDDMKGKTSLITLLTTILPSFRCHHLPLLTTPTAQGPSTYKHPLTDTLAAFKLEQTGTRTDGFTPFRQHRHTRAFANTMHTHVHMPPRTLALPTSRILMHCTHVPTDSVTPPHTQTHARRLPEHGGDDSPLS